SEQQRRSAGDQRHGGDPPLGDEAENQGHGRAGDQGPGRGDHVAGDQIGDQEDQRAAVIDEAADRLVRLWRRLRRTDRLLAHPFSSPTSDPANARALKGCRSSMPSPTPTSLIGESEAWATGTSTPPRAVPSSLVMTIPVTPIWLPKMFSWAKAFRPTVASSTSRVSCGASGSSFLMTRMTLCSSSISPCLFCSRPAVSISTTS